MAAPLPRCGRFHSGRLSGGKQDARLALILEQFSILRRARKSSRRMLAEAGGDFSISRCECPRVASQRSWRSRGRIAQAPDQELL